MFCTHVRASLPGGRGLATQRGGRRGVFLVANGVLTVAVAKVALAAGQQLFTLSVDFFLAGSPASPP